MLRKRIETHNHDIGGSSGFAPLSNLTTKLFYSTGIPLACIGALLLLGIYIVNPITNITNNSAYADENDGISTYATGDTSISMTLTNGAADQKTNAETGKVASRTNGISITAANVDGYQIFVQASSGSSSNLTNGTTTISGVGSNVAYSSIPDNKWGYSLYAGSDTASATGLSYSTVPESGSTVSAAYTTNATNSATGGDKFTLAFAAKFGNSATAGEYKTNVTLSVAAGAKETTMGIGFAGYTYMQDLDKAKCDAIPTGAEGRLIDKRDNQVYWVAKLKNNVDNNALCWMTQNLNYDGGAVTGYTGNDVATFTKGTNFTSSTQAQKLYYDPGEYVYLNSAETASCASINITDDTQSLQQCVYVKSESTASNADIAGLVDVSTGVPTNDSTFYAAASYISADGKKVCTKTADSYVGDMTSEYIPCRVYYSTYADMYKHYTLGNYYNWEAATNGTGHSTSANTNATGNICPTGWSLPLSGQNTGNFYDLLQGLKTTNVIIAPYYLVPSGAVVNSNLSNVNNEGSYNPAGAGNSGTVSVAWFSRSMDVFYTAHAGVGLSYTARSIRCVAR